jgi:hypothetical protein
MRGISSREEGVQAPFLKREAFHIMAEAHNVFDSGDLDLAQAIFDDIWSSLPPAIRNGSRNPEFKEWLAKQVLTSIKHSEDPMSLGLKARVMERDLSVWS